MSPAATATTASPATVRYLDDLDLARCVLGEGVVLDRETMTLYDVAPTREVRLIGTFSSPGAALSALDRLPA